MKQQRYWLLGSTVLVLALGATVIFSFWGKNPVGKSNNNPNQVKTLAEIEDKVDVSEKTFEESEAAASSNSNSGNPGINGKETVVDEDSITPEEYQGETPPRSAEAQFSTDFQRHTVSYNDVLSGGPSKAGITTRSRRYRKRISKA